MSREPDFEEALKREVDGLVEQTWQKLMTPMYDDVELVSIVDLLEAGEADE